MLAMSTPLPFDHGPLIKRNLLLLLSKYKTLETDDATMKERADEYEHALTHLPNHPILDIDDVRRIQTTPVIMQQIGELIRHRKDLT